ncbi:MAG: hypothetical protein KC940_17505 [Candidatus Omnitrophica bacterium]|nr:hypothetical protein [Candidatus Omnitrophota bacterium]
MVVTLRVPGFDITHEAFADLFWGFERDGDYVIQWGETSCGLYTKDGRLISSADVDPPYQAEKAGEGFRFISDVAGETWLNYPKS